MRCCSRRTPMLRESAAFFSRLHGRIKTNKHGGRSNDLLHPPRNTGFQPQAAYATRRVGCLVIARACN